MFNIVFDRTKVWEGGVNNAVWKLYNGKIRRQLNFITKRSENHDYTGLHLVNRYAQCMFSTHTQTHIHRYNIRYNWDVSAQHALNNLICGFSMFHLLPIIPQYRWNCNWFRSVARIFSWWFISCTYVFSPLATFSAHSSYLLSFFIRFLFLLHSNHASRSFNGFVGTCVLFHLFRFRFSTLCHSYYSVQ